MLNRKINLKQIIKWFFSVIIVGLLVGGLGNKLYYDFFQKPSLSYDKLITKISLPQTEPKNHRLKILVNDKEVNEIYLTTFKIKNTGGIPLDRSISSENNPLRIEGEGVDISFIDKNKTTKTSKIDLRTNDKNIFVDFDFLNPNDEIYVNLIHLKDVSLNIQGSFKNIKVVEQEQSLWNVIKTYAKFFIFIFLLCSIVGFVVLIILIYFILSDICRWLKKKLYLLRRLERD